MKFLVCVHFLKKIVFVCFNLSNGCFPVYLFFQLSMWLSSRMVRLLGNLMVLSSLLKTVSVLFLLTNHGDVKIVCSVPDNLCGRRH